MSQPVFLFSVDLEDVRSMIPNGYTYKARVPEMTKVFLDFLKLNKSKATFFVVGQLVEQYPDLIKEIADNGHEIACHTYEHEHLTKIGVEGFKQDIEQFLEVLNKVGIQDIVGFRAPTFSLVEESKWAYKVLASYGFKYSSSVLPVESPLFGWEGFGKNPKWMDGVLELPMAIGSFLGKKLPFSGGVYLRLLPLLLTRSQFSKYANAGLAIPSYIHPYDIDKDQERFMHPHLDDSKFLNYLMYVNRSKVMSRLQKIVNKGFTITTYKEYFEEIKDNIRQ